MESKSEREQAVRERNARYQRDRRARKRAERAEAARVASDGAYGVMRKAVEVSIGAAKWLSGSDAAAMQQARAIADIIDAADDVRLELRGHSLLSRVLGEMGLTPRVRTQLELRARKLASVTADAAIDAVPNVTRLTSPSRRPEKRPR